MFTLRSLFLDWDIIKWDALVISFYTFDILQNRLYKTILYPKPCSLSCLLKDNQNICIIFVNLKMNSVNQVVGNSPHVDRGAIKKEGDVEEEGTNPGSWPIVDDDQSLSLIHI